jgi:hypothetical protein
MTPPQVHRECVHLVAEFGTVPDGWTLEAWIERLREVAQACDPLLPEHSQRYRDWADTLTPKRKVERF